MSEKNIGPEPTDALAPQQSGTIKNIIPEKETTLREELDYQREHEGRLRYNLINLGLVSDDASAVFSRYYGIPSVNLELFQIDEHVLQLIPQEIAQKYSVFPLSRVGASLKLAMVDPTNVFAMDDIKFMTGLNVEPVAVAEASIQKAIAKFYGTSSENELSSPPQQSGTISSLSKMVDEIVQSTLIGLYQAPSSPIRGTLSLPLHSGIVDSTGNPIEPPRARDVSEALIGKSREDLNIIAIPASDFEKLSAKTAEILREAKLAYERMTKDQEETERLKKETREVLVRLRAA